jgi:dipeptidyl aminopeptidase/acylaminoacyl peptidase
MPPTPRELVRGQVALGDLAISPDGGYVVYTRRAVAGARYRTHLWLGAADGGSPRQLTRGDVSDAAPRFAPDGRRVAFLRDGQVWLIAIDGGEAEQVTELPHGVSAFRLAPDGRRLALRGAAPEPRFAVGPLREDEPPLARRITRVDWRLDGAGMLDRFEHLWIAPVRPRARARPLTHGAFGVEGFDWSPDGRTLVFAADTSADADLRAAPRLYLVDAAGGEPRELASLAGLCRTPAWSADGRHVAFRGVAAPGAPEDASRSIWVVPAAGGEPRDLAPAVHVASDVSHGSDLEDWALSEGVDLSWDGESVVCPVLEGGRCSLWRFPLEGEPGPVEAGGRHVLRYALADGRIAALLADGVEAPEVHVVAGGRTRRLTREGTRARRALRGLEQCEVDVPGPAGPIRTWVLGRAALGSGPAPTILSVHGGPTGIWSPVPWLPDLALAAAGYRVLRPDPRGSDSYGAAWLAAIAGSWGGADAEDCLAVTDWAVAEGLADPERLGVVGLSYGGFMTQWLIGVTERFRAAVAVNGVANQVSTAGNCDLAFPYNERLGWGPLPGAAETLWSQSPLANVDRITTPLLMLQGEADLRCPPADNEQLFVALRARRHTVEYVLYPGESHIMQATGRPDRRVDMLERTERWFAEHVLGSR